MPDAKTFAGEYLIDCPFCGKALHLSFDDTGHPDGVMHGVPSCERFDVLEPDEFLAAARIELERRRS